MCAHTQLLSLS